VAARRQLGHRLAVAVRRQPGHGAARLDGHDAQRHARDRLWGAGAGHRQGRRHGQPGARRRLGAHRVDAGDPRRRRLGAPAPHVGQLQHAALADLRLDDGQHEEVLRQVQRELHEPAVGGQHLAPVALALVGQAELPPRLHGRAALARRDRAQRRPQPWRGRIVLAHHQRRRGRQHLHRQRAVLRAGRQRHGLAALAAQVELRQAPLAQQPERQQPGARPADPAPAGGGPPGDGQIDADAPPHEVLLEERDVLDAAVRPGRPVADQRQQLGAGQRDPRVGLHRA
jgi:hypothetical protein